MASTKEYLDFVLEQLSELDEVSSRAMMGEYILYYRGKVFGGIYDDRLAGECKTKICLITGEYQLQRTSDMRYIIDSTKTSAVIRKLPITQMWQICSERILRIVKHQSMKRL